MVLNLLSFSSRLHEPLHTGAVVRLLGATAGAGTTTCGLDGETPSLTSVGTAANPAVAPPANLHTAAGGGSGVVVVVGGGVGHGANMHESKLEQ